MLKRLFRDPVHREPFFSSLTVAGRTGTIAGRMRNTPAAGNARAKDGAMAGVRALCGVVNTADGEPLIFAILANGFAVPDQRHRRHRRIVATGQFRDKPNTRLTSTTETLSISPECFRWAR